MRKEAGLEIVHLASPLLFVIKCLASSVLHTYLIQRKVQRGIPRDNTSGNIMRCRSKDKDRREEQG